MAVPTRPFTTSANTLVLVLFFFAAPAALSFLAPALAFAQQDQEAARDRFTEGRQAYQDEDYLLAAEKFLEAYDLSGRAELLYNVGQAYRRADALGHAERYFQQYLTQLPDAANADEVVETIIEIQRAKAAQMATIAVSSDPSGASIFVDAEAQPRCQTPCEIDLDPGTYNLRAELDGYQPETTPIELQARQEAETGISLNAAVQKAQLHVRSDVSGATMTIAGGSHLVPTSAPVEVAAGTHQVRFEYNGDQWQQEITLEAGEALHVYLPAGIGSGGDFSILRASAIGLGGASIALATAALLFGNQARQTHASLQTQQTNFGTVDGDLVHSGRSQQILANGLWIGAALTLGAGAGLWTWDMMSSRQSEALEPTKTEAPEPTKTDTDDDDERPGVDLL